MGIFFVTPPGKETRTKIFVRKNDGLNQVPMFTLKDINIFNSCNDYLSGRTTKVMIRIKDGELNIYNDNAEYVFSNCFTGMRLDEGENFRFTAPYRIGLSSLNGEYDGKSYNTPIEIEKVTVFNLDYEKREHFAHLNYTEDLSRLITDKLSNLMNIFDEIKENRLTQGEYKENLQQFEEEIYSHRKIIHTKEILNPEEIGTKISLCKMTLLIKNEVTRNLSNHTDVFINKIRQVIFSLNEVCYLRKKILDLEKVILS